MFFVSHTIPCSKCTVGLPFVLGKAPDYPDSRIGFQKGKWIRTKGGFGEVDLWYPSFLFPLPPERGFHSPGHHWNQEEKACKCSTRVRQFCPGAGLYQLLRVSNEYVV